MAKPLFAALAISISSLWAMSCLAQTDTNQPGAPQLSEADALPDPVTTYRSGSSSRVPFEWVNGEIVVTATINGIPDLKLIVDTGIVNSALQDEVAYGIRLSKSAGTYPIRGIGKELLQGSRSQNLNITMPGMLISQASLLIVPGQSFVAPMGVQVNGYLGYDILKNYVIRIDYINNTITFIDPQVFNSNTAGTSIPAAFENGRVKVTAVIQNNSVASPPTAFLMDTGCSVGLVLFGQFLHDNPGLVFADGVERQVDGVGGSLVVQSVTCSELQLGNIFMQDPYAQVVEQDPTGFSKVTGLIGNQIWKHFDVTIDFPGKRVFLRQNTLLDGTVRFAPSPSN